MCECKTANIEPDQSAFEADHVLVVEDMSCGHCASAIEDAVKHAFPNADVRASAATKTLELRGHIDVEAVKSVIRAAGYTPLV